MEEMDESTNLCLFCGNQIGAGCTISQSQRGDSQVIRCKGILNFATDIDNNAIKSLRNGKLKGMGHLIAGHLYYKRPDKYNSFKGGKIMIVEDAENIIGSAPRIMERLDMVLTKFYEHAKHDGLHMYNNSGDYPSFAFYAKNGFEVSEFISQLDEMGFLEVILKGSANTTFKLKVKGMCRAEELLSTNVNSKKVFIARKFGPEYLELEEVIKECCAECGFDAKTVSDHNHYGEITDKIIAEIKSSKFIVADYTENNLGVYYEAGYARGRDIPVIGVCHKKSVEKLHFDVRNRNMLLWEEPMDLREQLIGTIRALFC
jgi:nucleoside 2-deoxyribosyltransferase